MAEMREKAILLDEVYSILGPQPLTNLRASFERQAFM